MDEEMRKIECNLIDCLMQKKNRDGLDPEDERALNKLCDRHPSEAFFLFNKNDGVFDDLEDPADFD